MNTRMFVSILMVLAVFFLSSCEKDTTTIPDTFMERGNHGATSANRQNLQLILDTYPLEDLSAGEKASLAFMREEEKLAHDVYALLYDTWGTNIFTNIAASEQTHTEAVLFLLNRYDLDDSADGFAAGDFQNVALQDLYDELTTRGALSEVEALRVGALIEEVDILDLQNDLNQTIDNQDITLVYENLMKGSRNHLRAFVRTLERRGVVYTPEALTLEYYEAIINSDMETGH